ncbi:cbb3-type cytochrome c oxidase subunit I [Pseudomonas mandelii]
MENSPSCYGFMQSLTTVVETNDLSGKLSWPGENGRLRDRAPWMERVRWPLQFFVACAFWNMLGTGVFGFLINPPIALFYIQGLNTTLLHAHAALFGVYGFLALGFGLLILRYIRPDLRFNNRHYLRHQSFD